MSDSITFEIFEKSRQNRGLVGIYQTGDEDTFYSGYIIDYDEEFIQLQHFTKYGKADGILLLRIEDISGLDFGDDYAECLAYVIEHNETLDKQPAFEAALPSGESWQYDLLEQVLGSKELIVRVSYEDDSSYVGFITGLDHDYFLIQYIDAKGNEDGFARYSLEGIQDIRVNDLEARRRLMLYRWKQSKKS